MHDAISLESLVTKFMFTNHGQVHRMKIDMLETAVSLCCAVYLYVLVHGKASSILYAYSKPCRMPFDTLPGEGVSLSFGDLSFILRWSHVQCPFFTSWHYLSEQKKFSNHTIHAQIARIHPIWFTHCPAALRVVRSRFCFDCSFFSGNLMNFTIFGHSIEQVFCLLVVF